MIVFCKFYEPDTDDVTYLGHLLVEKTMPCCELLTHIAGMAELSTEINYAVFTEEWRFGSKEITDIQSSLAQV